MFAATFSNEEQRHLAKSVVSFLSQYKHITDSYVIEFFSENLWESLPVSWQECLVKLSPPEISNLLLDKAATNRRYPSVWPLSLLAFRASAHALAYPRIPVNKAGHHEEIGAPEEFVTNHSQSSLLGHIFRKHVKAKKQHEIQRLGTVVENLCHQTNCQNVIDVGSGQGHLTRFLSFGLGLSVTAIEADARLVMMARRFDDHLCWTLEKERLKKETNLDSSQLPQAIPGPAPRHVVGWVNPKATWEDFMEQLSRRDAESERARPVGGPCKQRPWISMSGPDHRTADETQCLCAAKCDCAPGRTKGDGTLSPPSRRADGRSPLLEDLQPSDGLLEASTVDPAKAAVDVDALATSLRYTCGFSAHRSCSEQSDDHQVKESSPGDGATINQVVGGDQVLTGLHACGDLSATLLRHFACSPRIQGITSVACCYMKITTKENPTPPGVIPPPTTSPTQTDATSNFGYPMSEWVRGLPGHELSYKARESACHAVEDFLQRLREDSDQLRTHCYRAVLETVIRAVHPDLRRAGIQTIRKTHTLTFAEYARLGLPRVGLSPDLPLDVASVEAMLLQQSRVVAYFSLVLLLAPVTETLVLLDRMLYLQEQGLQSQLVALFDPAFSPRNLVLVATKHPGCHRRENVQ